MRLALLALACLALGALGGILVAATEAQLTPAKTQDRLVPAASPQPITQAPTPVAPLPTVRIVGECRSA